MTRRSNQSDRIEQAAAQILEAVAGHATHLRDQVAALRIEVRDARTSAEATHAGLDALADMLAASRSIPPAAPQPPPAVQPAADGGTEGEPAAAARRAAKTLRKDQGM